MYINQRICRHFSFTGSISWTQHHIAFLDSTIKEFIIAQCSEVKACNLVASLGTILFQDVPDPRNGTSISMRAARPEQVASLIECRSFRYLDAITTHKENNVVDYLSIEA